MGRIVGRVQAMAIALGAPGLFLVAFLDSSFLSLPEIADLLVIWMVTQHKGRLVIYVISATLGSTAGCLLLYSLGRKGGDALVRKRFHSASVDKALAAFRRYGIMAVLIPSILPPPAPFKIFVLLAGVAGIGAWRFATAIIIGRGARYLTEGLLAVWYGERALAFMHANGKTVSLVVVGLLAGGFAGYLVWRKVRTR
jgi:membrane protein YqaA with SNARE-associated domain